MPESLRVSVANASLPREDPLALLSALVDKSLVRVEERAAGVRYRMLETVREYAAGELGAAEAAEAAEAMFEWALDLATRADAELSGADSARWRELLDDEYPNLRAALRWALDARKPRARPLDDRRDSASVASTTHPRLTPAGPLTRR